VSEDDIHERTPNLSDGRRPKREITLTGSCKSATANSVVQSTARQLIPSVRDIAKIIIATTNDTIFGYEITSNPFTALENLKKWHPSVVWVESIQKSNPPIPAEAPISPPNPTPAPIPSPPANPPLIPPPAPPVAPAAAPLPPTAAALRGMILSSISLINETDDHPTWMKLYYTYDAVIQILQLIAN
jgi:hypothetical protein